MRSQERHARKKLVGAVMALTLVAAACGSDSDTDAETPGTDAPVVRAVQIQRRLWRSDRGGGLHLGGILAQADTAERRPVVADCCGEMIRVAQRVLREREVLPAPSLSIRSVDAALMAMCGP